MPDSPNLSPVSQPYGMRLCIVHPRNFNPGLVVACNTGYNTVIEERLLLSNHIRKECLRPASGLNMQEKEKMLTPGLKQA